VESAINIVLHAGRSAVDVALYTLLPIMVVMMIVMRLLETLKAFGEYRGGDVRRR
jgi:sorbitol-specific phosphotransferase system component IIBC